MILNTAAVVSKYLVDSEVAVYETENKSNDEWYTTYDKMPENPYQWIMVKNVGENLIVKPVRQGKEWESYPSIQLLIRGDRDYSGRTKGKEISDLLDTMYQVLVTLDGRTFRIQGFHKTSPLTFVRELERDDMQEYSINGNPTIMEV